MVSRFPLYSILIPIYVVLFLFGSNVGSLGAKPLCYLVSPLSVVLLLSGGSLALLWLGLRDLEKAGIWIGLFWFAASVNPPVAGLGGELLAVAIFAGAGLLAWQLTRRNRLLSTTTRVLNILTAAFALLAVARIVAFWPSAETGPPAEQIIAPRLEGQAPHIYYIILDGYGRSDVLSSMYGYENQDFLDELREIGFAVADRATSNYTLTPPSLASALNMHYLDDVASVHDSTTSNRRPLVELIHRSRLLDLLVDRGYSVTTFSSGSVVTDFFPARETLSAFLVLNEFENMLLSFSSFPRLLSLMRRLPGGDAILDQAELHRRRVRYTLEHLADPAKRVAPQFVLAHLMSPHVPFVFTDSGERPPDFQEFSFWDGYGEQPAAVYERGYRSQVAFLDRELPAAIRKIFENAPTPPVVVIQGDHGPGSQLHWSHADFEAGVLATNMAERLPILTALHLPNGAAAIPEDLTPVNIFRLVLNSVFHTDLEPLPNRNYYVSWRYPLRFVDVTDRLATSEE